jgi:hypothetical protein
LATDARELPQVVDHLVEGTPCGLSGDHAPDAVREHLPREIERRVHRMKVCGARRLVGQSLHRHAPEQGLEMSLAVARRLALDPVRADHRGRPLELRPKPKVLLEHQPRPLHALTDEHRFQVRVGLTEHLVARQDTLDLRNVRPRARERNRDGLDRIGTQHAHPRLLSRADPPSPSERHAPAVNSSNPAQSPDFTPPQRICTLLRFSFANGPVHAKYEESATVTID